MVMGGMVMNWQDLALGLAGLIGSGVALVHGLLTQRLMVEPFRAMASTARTPASIATALLVGSSYLFGAAGNLWATRGRHPGWLLYAIALGLIVYGVY